MENKALLREMDKYARNLIINNLEDFTDHDTKVINTTNAEIPFVWIIHKNGTRLFLCNKEENIWKLVDLINAGIEKTELAYIYDGTYFRPESFENVREWITGKLYQLSCG